VNREKLLSHIQEVIDDAPVRPPCRSHPVPAPWIGICGGRAVSVKPPVPQAGRSWIPPFHPAWSPVPAAVWRS